MTGMSANPYDRYAITRARQLVDSAPMKDGGGILTFDKGEWKAWHGTVGEWKDSTPVTAEEAAQFCTDGSMPERVGKAIADDTGYYPEPWDDD